MAGSKFGAIKRKLGLKGKTQPGQMIGQMNAIKAEAKSEGESTKIEKGEMKAGQKKSPMKYKSEGMLTCKTCGMSYKNGSMHEHKIKKTGKSFGKSNKLGGGGRFAQVKNAVAKKPGVTNPAGLAAYIGRKSLGKARFQSLAAKARK